ncbi:MAG: Gldg family protein [Lachnospiraceae bacterium]|nr:Gldg family protein [Lachnospiraceae bacterium]
MTAIYKKELRSYFHSVTGWLFMAVTLFFVGLYFSVYNLQNSYPFFAYAVSGTTFIFMISVPVLTMRILAEERHTRTDQLLLTSPVSVGSIVLGKYLAAATVFAIPVAVICLYPLIMNLYGTVPFGETYTAILGYLLFGLVCIAIGVFVSGWTESQVTSAVLAFLVLFLGYLMPSLCSLISPTGNLLTRVLGAYDIYTPFEAFTEGTLDLTAVFYDLTLIALSLFLTTQVIQKRRYTVSVKQLRLGAYSGATILLAIVLAVVSNALVKAIPSTLTAIDTTYNNVYTLGDQTKAYLKTLNDDVVIYVWGAEKDTDVTVKNTLSYYEDLSSRITVKYVDPMVNPRFYASYTSTAPASGSLIIVGSKRNKVVAYDDLYESTYSMDYATYSYNTVVTGYDAEGQITGAINYVCSSDVPKVYMLSGHGEAELDSGYTDALAKGNIEYETVNLMNCDAVPEDAAAVLLFAPSTDLSADDVTKLTDYLDRGGKVTLCLKVNEEEQPYLAQLLDYMGITVESGIVVEQQGNGYYQSPLYILPTIGSSVYTTELYDSGYMIFAPYNVGLILPEEAPEGITYDSFLETSESAFLMTDYTTATDYSMRDGDLPGPFPLGVEAVRSLEDGSTATMVVYANASMFTREADQMVSGANNRLFMNTLDSFIDREVNISIPVKSYDLDYLVLNSATALRWEILTVVLVPVGLLAAGIVIWIRRRRK